MKESGEVMSWFQEIDSKALKRIWGTPDSYVSSQKIVSINRPFEFNNKSVDQITNFNHLIDTLKLDIDSFDINTPVTFASSRNKRCQKKLNKQNFDFIFDEKKGGPTSTKMELKKASVMAASLLSLKVYLI